MRNPPGDQTNSPARLAVRGMRRDLEGLRLRRFRGDPVRRAVQALETIPGMPVATELDVSVGRGDQRLVWVDRPDVLHLSVEGHRSLGGGHRQARLLRRL